MGLFKHFYKDCRGKKFIQVGAHDGVTRDYMNRWITKYHWRGILVEPIKPVFDKLVGNYKGEDGLIFENCAITNRSGETNIYYSPTHDESTAVEIHHNRLKRLYDEDEVEILKVKCMTIMNLIEKHNYYDVQVIVLDTNGIDYEIIKSMDFEYITPKVICYELTNKEKDNKIKRYLGNIGFKFYSFGHDVAAYKGRLR